MEVSESAETDVRGTRRSRLLWLRRGSDYRAGKDSVLHNGGCAVSASWIFQQQVSDSVRIEHPHRRDVLQQNPDDAGRTCRSSRLRLRRVRRRCSESADEEKRRPESDRNRLIQGLLSLSPSLMTMALLMREYGLCRPECSRTSRTAATRLFAWIETESANHPATRDL
jgi:hypothetical protein